MIPVVSIVGRSNSGKTTLIERIIPILKQRGYRVGTIKHDAHRFEIDHEGKDSWRMAKAGADTVVIGSEDKMAMVKVLNGDKSIDEIINWLFQDVDIVITEGYKSYNNPKIEIIRFDLPVTPAGNNLIAIIDNNINDDRVFELQEEYSFIKVLNFNEYIKIAEFIENRFLKKQR